jgi:hypothetical protein
VPVDAAGRRESVDGDRLPADRSAILDGRRRNLDDDRRIGDGRRRISTAVVAQRRPSPKLRAPIVDPRYGDALPTARTAA